VAATDRAGATPSLSGEQPLRRGLVFATDALAPLPELARQAERAGLDRVWTTEYEGRDAIVRALAIAQATERIGVATGIAYAFARTPRAMAAAAADVARLSGGRFALGIGPGTPGIRRRYGAEEFTPPARRIATYVDDLRQAWSEDQGLPEPPKVYAAALQPVMARTAARVCDGVLLHALALTRTHLNERLVPALGEGLAQRAGHPAPEIVAWCVTVVDEDEAAARERARAQLAFYLVTPSFAPVTAGTAWEPAAAALREAFEASSRRAGWEELARLVPDGLVDELAIWGGPARVRERAGNLEAELRPLGVTELVFQTAGAALDARGLVGDGERIVAAFRRP
jgi:alkanesulfonate monooxygenase SsuD/methylene tetrahydromethanopterin reductase-like flavin-dependent oxidoreductase (luciferase family)